MPQPTRAPHRDELLWALTGLLLGLALYLATDQVLAGTVVGLVLGGLLFAVERVRRRRPAAHHRRGGRDAAVRSGGVLRPPG